MDQRTYRIEIEGRVPGLLAEDLPQMSIEVEDGITSLTGRVPDGSALYGLIARLEAIGVDLRAVRAQPDPDPYDVRRRPPAVDGDDSPGPSQHTRTTIQGGAT
jgi:hypothetical protein